MQVFKTMVLVNVVAVSFVIRSEMALAADDNLYRLNLGSQLQSDVRKALPESSAVDTNFLSSDYNPNITLSADSHLSVSFIDEGAGYRNSVGYFEYSNTAFEGLTFDNIDSNNSGNISFNELNALDGVQADYMFSNFSESGGGGSLRYGDSLVIGGGSLSETADGLAMEGGKVFQAGTNVGFFLSANAFTGSGISGVDNSRDPNNFFSVDFLNPEAGLNATFGNAGANARHTAMMFADTTKDAVLIGFEDLIRPGGDNDFNDAIFLVQSDPATALSGNNLEIATAPLPTLGQGGVSGLLGLLMGATFLTRRRKLRKS